MGAGRLRRPSVPTPTSASTNLFLRHSFRAKACCRLPAPSVFARPGTGRLAWFVGNVEGGLSGKELVAPPQGR